MLCLEERLLCLLVKGALMLLNTDLNPVASYPAENQNLVFISFNRTLPTRFFADTAGIANSKISVQMQTASGLPPKNRFENFILSKINLLFIN